MDKLLTVIVQTSPLPSHPSTALIEALFRSFDRVEHLKECNIIILCDGCGEENQEAEHSLIENNDQRQTNYKHGSVSQDSATNYLNHLQLLREKIEKREEPFDTSIDGTIKLLKLPFRHGSAKAIAAAFDIISIDTPYVLIAQHDNFFVRDVNYLQQLIHYMELEETKSWLHCVHFPSTATLNYMQKVKRRYSLDLEKFCKTTSDSALQGQFVPLAFWYGRTHIARTCYYKEKILAEYPIKVGDHLEEIWGTKQLNKILEVKSTVEGNDFEASFKELHSKFGNYVFFGNDADSEQQEVLYHLSGRKVHATDETADKKIPYATNDGSSTSGKGIFHPQDKSFTTARRAMAIVPGLEFAHKTGKSDKIVNTGQVKPTKFRQRCFHCGEKGHSFKFCPEITHDEQMPSMEILDLS